MRRAKFTKQVTVMLDPAVSEQIKQITDEKEISIGEWIREAVDKALERELEIKPIQDQDVQFTDESITDNMKK